MKDTSSSASRQHFIDTGEHLETMDTLLARCSDALAELWDRYQHSEQPDQATKAEISGACDLFDSAAANIRAEIEEGGGSGETD